MSSKSLPPKTPDPEVWIIGDWRHAEFAEAIEWLHTKARCLRFENAAAARLSRQAPAAILLVQSRPGEISRGNVERLSAAGPLARLVALVGAWCEGDSRGGQSLAGVVRVPVSLWRWRLGQELDLSGDNGSPASVLPRTVTAAERIEAQTIRLSRDRGRGGRAIVVSSRRESWEAVGALLAQLGMQPVCIHEARQNDRAVEVVVLDGWQDDAAAAAVLADIQAPRVLLLHFPREEDFERARREKIEAVLAQPVILGDLAKAIGGI